MTDRAAALQLAQANDDPPAAAAPNGGVLNAIDEMAGARLDEWLLWLQAYPWAQTLAAAAVVLLVAGLAHLVGRRYLLRAVVYISGNLPTWWARVVRENLVFDRLVPVIPVIVINRGVALVPHLSAASVDFVQRLMLATLAIVLARAMGALLNAALAIYNHYPISRGRPIKGYVQVVKLVVYLLAGFMVIAALSNQSPWFFISGLGAMTAIISLIFRDTILSFVAGIQLVNNDLVRVGDWIDMPQFDADGDVIDIALNVVRVQNWDRTITVIPAHKFLEHSFRNWRGMEESGGRRIARTLCLDMSTVRFLTREEIERLRRMVLLRGYIESKEREIEEWNREHVPEDCVDVMANARALTNIGTFRAYVAEYLKNHPRINHDLTTMVRQMEPTAQGVGIQVYGFTNDTRWAFYEGIQGDIFDHILSVVPEFGLRVFQEPAGSDVRALADALKAGGERSSALLGRPGRGRTEQRVRDA